MTVGREEGERLNLIDRSKEGGRAGLGSTSSLKIGFFVIQIHHQIRRVDSQNQKKRMAASPKKKPLQELLFNSCVTGDEAGLKDYLVGMLERCHKHASELKTSSTDKLIELPSTLWTPDDSITSIIKGVLDKYYGSVDEKLSVDEAAAIRSPNSNLATMLKEELEEILPIAVEGGQVKIVCHLINCGIDWRQGNDQFFRDACLSGNYDLIQLMFSLVATAVGGGILPYEVSDKLEHAGASLANGTGIATGLPLQNACRGGHLKIVNLLLHHGAKINENGCGALIAACYYNKLEVVNFLISRGADCATPMTRIFVDACGNGNLKLVKLVLESDIFPSVKAAGPTPLEHRNQNRSSGGMEQAGLIAACSKNRVEVVRYLTSGMKPLSKAPKAPSTVELKSKSGESTQPAIGSREWLAEIRLPSAARDTLGADSKAYDEKQKINLHHNGEEALRIACHDGNIGLAKLLISRGADIYYSDDQLSEASATPLLIKLLLTMNRDLCRADMTGETGYTVEQKSRALFNACRRGSTECAKLLLDDGADVTWDNDCSLQTSFSLGHLETTRLLIHRGANFDRFYKARAFRIPGPHDSTEYYKLFEFLSFWSLRNVIDTTGEVRQWIYWIYGGTIGKKRAEEFRKNLLTNLDDSDYTINGKLSTEAIWSMIHIRASGFDLSHQTGWQNHYSRIVDYVLGHLRSDIDDVLQITDLVNLSFTYIDPTFPFTRSE
jgi:ankyrin repeat protein